MDLQKEKIAHEKHLLSQGVDFKYLPNIQYNELENVYELIEWGEEYSEALNEINSSWCTWQAAKASAVPEWISVEDKLPSDDIGRVLAWVVEQNSLGKCGFAWNCSHSNGVFSDKFETFQVTHWMPLPDAPQEPANESK